MGRLAAHTLAVTMLLVVAGCVSVSVPVTTDTVGGEGQQATVVEVVDADTLEVEFADGRTDTVRLLGIDSPEVHVENQPEEFEGVPDTEAGEACLREAGHNASAFVRERAAGATVTLLFDPLSDRRDSYDRLLAYVQFDGGDLNRQLVERGHARVFDSRFSRSDTYYDLEATAQSQRRGLWHCRSANGSA